MFEVGQLLKFNPFLFKNGASPKPKFFVVLAHLGNELLLASLPTSKDHVPQRLEHRRGCISDNEQRFNVFVFDANETIATNESGGAFAFPLRTYIYGEQLDSYVQSVFEQQIQTHQTDVTILGTLLPNIFDDLKQCLKNSAVVKRGFKRTL